MKKTDQQYCDFSLPSTYTNNFLLHRFSHPHPMPSLQLCPLFCSANFSLTKVLPILFLENELKMGKSFKKRKQINEPAVRGRARGQSTCERNGRNKNYLFFFYAKRFNWGWSSLETTKSLRRVEKSCFSTKNDEINSGFVKMNKMLKSHNNVSITERIC